jgi:hypothetical protein
MRIDEVRGGREQTIELSADTGGFDLGPKPRDEASLVLAGADVVLGAGGRAWTVVGANGPSRRALAEVTGAGLPCIAWVVRADPKRVFLHVRQFPSALRLPEPITFRVDDATREEARRVMQVGGTATEVAHWLTEQLLLGPGPGNDPAVRRAVVSAGAGVGAMRVYGPRVSVDLASRDGVLSVERMVRGTVHTRDTSRLLVAPMSFVDASVSGALAASTRAALDAAVRSSGSYLDMWRHYTDVERDQMSARAGEFGAVPYSRCERDGGQWRLALVPSERQDDPFDGLEGDACFELSAARPEIEREREATDGPAKGRREARDGVTLRFVRRSRETLVLEPLDEDSLKPPPAQGWMQLSTVGDQKRIERREAAQQRVREGNGPMPQLGLILEGSNAPTTHYKSRAGMSAAARAAFGRGPTPRQEEALQIAINTPDIAMIQGPPGTGKTSVITAIQRRIAELDGDDTNVRHRMLVTSAQHDAVENVVARTSVFGLPAVKIGVRRGGGDGAGVDGAELFQEAQAERLRATLVSVTEAERLRLAREHIATLLAQPGTPAQNAEALRDVQRAITGLVPPALLDALEAREKSLRTEGASDDDERILQRRAAQGLPCTAIQFEDGGQRMAARALLRLGALLTDSERSLLERCARWDGGAPPPWIADVARVREALLDRLQPPSATRETRLDEETRALLVRLAEAMRDGLGTRRTQEESVVANFLHELETDPDGVRDTLQDYTAVLAATLQHSAAKPMREARGIDTGNLEFDSVLVDEAARAHPLDLLIPLSMGRRRIVLVGDHRQLPHMLEPQVERAILAGDLASETERALKESLFQRLWNHLKAREKEDGVPRTDTLDQQFRMHPVLGDFVSRWFYEAKGDPPITSPRPAEEFQHGLAQFTRGRERVAAWIDVPADQGRERGKPSPARRCEAERVARLAKEILQSDPSLSVGVISFYRGQVDEIAVALERLDVMEKRKGDWRVREEWRVGRDRGGETIERFRLNTVDAFQGKEFDVVILSVTRSNALPATTDAERRRKYGHLLLDNRLCVAMSRQRRLLITVGDLDFVRRAEGLPALRGFIQLCEGPDGIVE